MDKKKIKNSPRIKVIQKLYNSLMNPSAKIEYPKSQYKKFIKDVVNGTIEREDLIQELIKKELKNDINISKTDLLIQLMLMAAIYEFMYMHKTPVSVVIGEYLKVSDFFLEKSKKNFLNAILDKISKVSRVTEI